MPEYNMCPDQPDPPTPPEDPPKENEPPEGL